MHDRYLCEISILSICCDTRLDGCADKGRLCDLTLLCNIESISIDLLHAISWHFVKDARVATLLSIGPNMVSSIQTIFLIAACII